MGLKDVVLRVTSKRLPSKRPAFGENKSSTLQMRCRKVSCNQEWPEQRLKNIFNRCLSCACCLVATHLLTVMGIINFILIMNQERPQFIKMKSLFPFWHAFWIGIQRTKTVQSHKDSIGVQQYLPCAIIRFDSGTRSRSNPSCGLSWPLQTPKKEKKSHIYF